MLNIGEIAEQPAPAMAGDGPEKLSARRTSRFRKYRKVAAARMLLEKSPTGKALLKLARHLKITIVPDPQLKTAGVFYPGENKIAINPSHSAADMATTLVHELRHAWQDQHEISEGPTLTPRDYILMVRATEADSEAISVLVGWELKQAGHGEVLAAHLESSYGDISRKFLNEMAASGNLKMALRSAYDQWFAKHGRIDGYNSDGIRNMEERLDDHIDAMRAKEVFPLSNSELHRLGEMPLGGNYLNTRPSRNLLSPEYRAHISPAHEKRLCDLEIQIGLRKPPPPPRPLFTPPYRPMPR